MLTVVMRSSATETDIARVEEEARKYNLEPIQMPGEVRMIIILKGDERVLPIGKFKSMKGVSNATATLEKYKMASRSTKYEDTVIDLGDGITIGGKQQVVMAGPCAIESEQQFRDAAEAVYAQGIRILRGGAYKPRTSPYSFQGMGEDGLKILKNTAEELGMKTITEIMDVRKLETVCKYADMIQLGARNMQNYDLLKEIGKCGKPVMIKNALSATIEEFLLAAEYILSEGNTNVVLCDRGIRTFEKEVRFTINLGTVQILKDLTHLPIIVDPSHCMGRREYVPNMALASLASGSHGIIVEVHCNPEEALCDGAQALTPSMFEDLMNRAEKISNAIEMPLSRAH